MVVVGRDVYSEGKINDRDDRFYYDNSLRGWGGRGGLGPEVGINMYSYGGYVSYGNVTAAAVAAISSSSADSSLSFVCFSCVLFGYGGAVATVSATYCLLLTVRSRFLFWWGVSAALAWWVCAAFRITSWFQARGFVTCLTSCGALACRLLARRGGTRKSWKRPTFSR